MYHVETCRLFLISKLTVIGRMSPTLQSPFSPTDLQQWLQAQGVYEGTYWDLLANIGELTEALTQMAVGPTVLEEPVLQLPPSPTLPSWDTFKPVLQPLPPLPQVLCCAVLCCVVLCCGMLCCAALCWPVRGYADYAGCHSAVLCCTASF